MVDRPNKPSNISASPIGPQPQIKLDNDKVTAQLPSGDSVTVLLHGATVTSWKSQGKENLWLSDKAVLDGSKPVRGGIPIVFPVFGAPPDNHATSALPQHGLARNTPWDFLGKSTSESSQTRGKDNTGTGKGDGVIKLDFGLSTSSLPASLRKQWPHDFGLVYSVTLGKDRLETLVNVRNEGDKAFEFQLLLHSYFRVGDIGKVAVSGLMGAEYVDKVLGGKKATESASQVAITGEVDRVYKNLKQDTTTILEGGKPRFDVIRDNLKDTVVWNLWKEKAQAMGDFAPKDGYLRFVCVEVGSVDGWVKLEGGETFEAGQVVKSHL